MLKRAAVIFLAAGLVLSAASARAQTGDVTAAITKQINSLVGGKVVTTIELVTLVAYPGSRRYVSLAMPPGFTVKSLSVNNTACPNTPGSTCRQRWLWALDPGRNCTLNGNYQSNYNKVCAGGLNCGAGPRSVPFKLQSENFCATYNINP